MTRPRRTKPTPTAPLAERIRQAIASDWTSLTTLDTLTGARGSDARRAVHEALGALRGEGAVLEERVTAAGVEVRLLTLPAPVPVEVASADTAEPHGEPDAAPVAVEPSAPAAAPQGPAAPEREPTDPHFVECRRCKADPGHPCKGPGSPHTARAADAEAWARVQDGLPPAPVELILIDRTPDANGDDAHYIEHGTEAMKAALPPREPGPSSRCAGCSAVYRGHAPADGHAFAPKPRGRPRVAPVAPIPNAAPAILPRARQRRSPGPIVAVDGGRVERFQSHATPETRAMLDAVVAEADARLAATQAADPDVEELPTPSEQKAILAGMAAKWDAALVERAAEREAAEASTEPETSRGGGEETSDDATRDTDGDRPGARDRVPERAQIVDGQPGVPGAVENQAPSVARAPRAKRSAPADGMGVAPQRCRPPTCHADDIHEPSRVRGFARPLCERHQRWVEGAGGTVAAGGLAGVVAQAREPST